MGSSTKTPTLSLPQFADSDKPTWRGDINDAFSKIDADAGSFTTKLNNLFGGPVTSLLNPDGSIKKPIVKGADGKRYKVIACALRYVDGTQYWQPISDTNHHPVGISSVVSSATNVTINYDFTTTGVGSILVVADETLSPYGVSAGCSVGTASALMTITRDRIADYVYYNGVTWVSLSNVFSNMAFDTATGKLTLTHDPIGGATGFATARNGAVAAQIDGTTPTTTEVLWRSTPQIITDYISYNGTTWVSSNGNSTGLVYDGSGKLTVTHAPIAGFGVSAFMRDVASDMHCEAGTLGSTTTEILFKTSAGVKATAPTTAMRIYFSRMADGGGIITTPNTTQRAFIKRVGGGAINPQAPGSILMGASANFWLIGFMEIAA